MARDTLNTLRYELRAMCDVTPAEYSLGTALFWDDDQLDAVLDRHRTDVYQAGLESRPTRTGGGTLSYQHYYSEYSNFEESSGGTALFVVEDTAGNDVSGYTVDYQRGIVTFAANTSGSAYLITGRSFDLNAAAADIWKRKAARYAQAYDVSTDNHSLSRSQLMKHALEMAEYYGAMAEPTVVTLHRSDNWGECL